MAIPIPQNDAAAQEVLDNMKPIEPGVYTAVIDAVEETEVQKETSDYYGKPMLKVTFKLTDPKYPNRKAWRQYIFAGKPFAFTIKFLEALGIRQADLGETFDPQVLKGRACRVALAIPKGTEPGEDYVAEVSKVLKAEATQQAASMMP